ncbi:D-Ala-D-Ala carboxypeptidase VanY [Paenibacillus daejeonensis]|uniref:D-Ala-D-Ala carboxypeptidase VanY n=1 Tax=Paenibacillus daejeonensis TaxID=135193 RepID=UPI000374602D|nr:D-Ala-D-Ala carboxypeptidase VanY [Paenibacillus daejeonensis]
MNKWYVSIGIVLIIGCVLSISMYLGPHQTEPATDNSEITTIPEDVLLEDREHQQAIEITKDDVHSGHLLLINQDYGLVPGNEAPDIIQLSKHPDFSNRFVLLDQATELSEHVAQQFSIMINAAAGEGISSFLISSGYRSAEKQNELFESLGPEQAMPGGHSEHNHGSAIDVGSSQGGIEHSPEGKWLREHAAQYGFILRYPKNKTHITGIQYEPWHFRYVGLPHSLIMSQKDFVLEEYLSYLKEQPFLSFKTDEETFHIYYYPVSENQTIYVGQDNTYTVSGNNTDGVIITEKVD